ncbi:hypothetical protein VNI00_000452 [Paramarasmius palmivorus]|uniref:Uncharacterized protein n=1 Tax=Paramarasmius palmivorus TaxID=297713 RepID=A0AAW0E5S2_9AGAR
MAVIGSHNFTIGCATNIVEGDQHNQTINIRFEARQEQQQAQRKEDGLELIDEYRNIRLGDIYKVEETGFDELEECEHDEDGRSVLRCTGKRTWYRARLYGDDKVYTGVTYSGREASKVPLQLLYVDLLVHPEWQLWKEDFVKYSGSHNLSDSAVIWQLLGINRSKVPALIFYDGS